MATVLTRTIRTRIPQRDGNFLAEVEFTVQNWNRVIHIRATMLPAGTDVDAWADGIEAKLDERLREAEWGDVLREAQEGINPLRAEKIYTFNTKMEIAQRLLDKAEPHADLLRQRLSTMDNIINYLKVFLGLV